MKTYQFTFPFRGQVKTQLIISKNRLVKPKNVKKFENAIRATLAELFPLKQRPIKGHLEYTMIHYTTYKKDEDDLIIPEKDSDLDNIIKTLLDCFQPVYKNVPKTDEDGDIILTKKGNVSYTKEKMSEGVIKDDKYVVRAGLYWIPVEDKEDERIEVFISPIKQKELHQLPKIKGDIIKL